MFFRNVCFLGILALNTEASCLESVIVKLIQSDTLTNNYQVVVDEVDEFFKGNSSIRQYNIGDTVQITPENTASIHWLSDSEFWVFFHRLNGKSNTSNCQVNGSEETLLPKNKWSNIREAIKGIDYICGNSVLDLINFQKLDLSN